jgi:hypothetical protein
MRLHARVFALVGLACVACVALVSIAHARLFRQTYGATVPTENGCAWNINQDYFVPRHCDSCRYDLFSACKTSHTISPACKNMHPVYCGYCTPYGECRYRWRDHVYKKFCGCTPLRYTYGPWRFDNCTGKCHGSGGAAGCAFCGGGGCAGCLAGGAMGVPAVADARGCAGYGMYADAALANVEPMGGQSLGAIDALGAAAAGSVGSIPAASMTRPGASMSLQGPAAALPPLPPAILPSAAGGAMIFPAPGVN